MKYLQHMETDTADKMRNASIIALQASISGNNEIATENLALIAGYLTGLHDLCIERDANKRKPRPPKPPTKVGK